ncbi:MAG: bis-aminopropyl spermidine synthase family protein [Candidatus Saccharimonadales bacterium]
MSLPEGFANSRPTADHKLEQFLMTPASLEQQVALVGPFLSNKTVFFLGDDDHISPLLARRYNVTPAIYEYDERIRESLTAWFTKLHILNYSVAYYDARQPMQQRGYEAFYINPPYSSRAQGLGAKVWLMRATEACIDNCEGVLVMPSVGGTNSQPWVKSAQQSVSIYLAQNGLDIMDTDLDASNYAETTDAGLHSSNLYLYRSNPKLSQPVEVGNLYN